MLLKKQECHKKKWLDHARLHKRENVKGLVGKTRILGAYGRMGPNEGQELVLHTLKQSTARGS